MSSSDNVASATARSNSYGYGNEKKSVWHRAVDSFKPPVDQKGWIPERNEPQVRVQTVNDMEKNEKEGYSAGVVRDEDNDDNGGLKRGLHGRHLQVCTFAPILSTGPWSHDTA